MPRARGGVRSTSCTSRTTAPRSTTSWSATRVRRRARRLPAPRERDPAAAPGARRLGRRDRPDHGRQPAPLAHGLTLGAVGGRMRQREHRRAALRSTLSSRRSARTRCSRARTSCASSATPSSTRTWDDYSASAVVMPTTVEEVQAVVRVANEHRRPALDARRGHEQRLRRPGAAGRRVGDRLAAEHEQGARDRRGAARTRSSSRACSWFDLYDAIQAGGHRLMVSIPDLGWGSVVGNFLDNGITYLPVAQDMAAYCGMEVVLANGERAPHGHGRDAEQPLVARLQARASARRSTSCSCSRTIGIVTKLGVWLTPWPECYMPLWLRRRARGRPRPGRRHAARG